MYLGMDCRLLNRRRGSYRHRFQGGSRKYGKHDLSLQILLDLDTDAMKKALFFL
jgi:hypothetical protein